MPGNWPHPRHAQPPNASCDVARLRISKMRSHGLGTRSVAVQLLWTGKLGCMVTLWLRFFAAWLRLFATHTPVGQEPGRTSDTHHGILANARVGPTGWTRNLAAPPTHTTAYSQTHADNIHDGLGTRPHPSSHSLTYSQSTRGAYSVGQEHGRPPPPHTPPLSHKRGCRTYMVDQEPGRTPVCPILE